MQQQYSKRLIGLGLIACVGTMLSCAADRLPLTSESSLSPTEIAYYNDDFDKMREDLWDRAGYLYRDEQMQNFKQTDMHFENGKLVLRTKTGSFSKGGLATRYALRGNFDIQLDCRMDFIKGLSSADMDQLFSFGVLDKNLKPGKMNMAVIGLSMNRVLGQAYLFSNCVENGKPKKGGGHMIENFNGSLRILRKGQFISVLYKTMGTTEWTPKATCLATANDMMVGFQLRNFFNKRVTIQAKDSISIEIDRFKINDAQQIIEEDI